MVEKGNNIKYHQKISEGIITYTELCFYILGRKIASHPKKTIAICWIIVFISCIGFVRFHQEKNTLKLWVPQNSPFVAHSSWLMATFQRGYRLEGMILKADDVLTPEVLHELALIDNDVKHIKTKSGIQFKDVCFTIPDISPTNNFMSKLEFSCDLLAFIDNTCYQETLLELWDYDLEKLSKTNKQDILNMINTYKQHPVFGEMKNYEDLLGGVERNETGHIISAKTLHSKWMLNVNFSAIDIENSGNAAGTADWASEEVLQWEKSFINYMEIMSKHMNKWEAYFGSARSFGDISNSTIFQDIDILAMGLIVMVIYVQLVISKFNLVEARVLLGLLGLLTIVMAYITGCGICSMFGVSYGPVHTSLPFLLMGLGVDDMFIVLACWNELTDEQNKLPLTEKVATMLKHAGVSITITTVTDILAFFVGSTTVLPSLKSYCIYAAIGVLMTFLFTITFFVACFTLDEKRVVAERNCCLPCIKYENFKKNSCSQKRLSKRIFRAIYSRIILTWPGKLFVMLVTVTLFGLSMESIYKLEQRFDPMWFIPSHTHFGLYIKERKEFYPNLGIEGSFYVGSINYTQEMNKLIEVNDRLFNSTKYINSINSWIEPYRLFLKEKVKKDVYIDELTDYEFHKYLTDFLYTNGSKFQGNFQFETNLKCGELAPKIEVSSINFRFNLFSGPEEHIPAMNAIVGISEDANFTTGDKKAFVWSLIFASWITDEIIDGEVLRNLGLALGCVMFCTILLIVNFQMCLLIFICVLLTMVNVCGFMQRWGMTIDVMTCIGLQLAIGLCVDYATHIGHLFLKYPEGSRNDRVLETVSSIGAAVMYGGFSTLIGISMLSLSEAYAFKVFFRIFFMVVLFGLFNGVVFLPVILSWFGPKPYRSHQIIQQNELLS